MLSFVFLGVGSGSTGISQIVSELLQRHLRQRLVARLAPEEDGRAPEERRGLARLREQARSRRTSGTTRRPPSRRYTKLRPKDTDQLARARRRSTCAAPRTGTRLPGASSAYTQALTPSSLVAPKSTSALGKALATVTNPLASAVSAQTSARDEQRLPQVISYLGQRLDGLQEDRRARAEGRDHPARARPGGLGCERHGDRDRRLQGVPQARPERLVGSDGARGAEAARGADQGVASRRRQRRRASRSGATVPRTAANGPWLDSELSAPGRDSQSSSCSRSPPRAAAPSARSRPSDGDPATGKALFIKTCGSCHTLADAGTTGTVGPNLDDAFLPDKQQGFDESTIIDVVRGQIAYADSNTGTDGQPPGHDAEPPRGQDAKDVAVYVAKCAGDPKCGVTAATAAEAR